MRTVPEPYVREQTAAFLAERGEELVAVEKLPLWNVGRLIVRGAGGKQFSMIAKWLRTSVGSDIAGQGLRTEAAALRYLDDVEPPIAPTFVGATSQLLIMEDLVDGSLLWEMLKDNGPAAGDAYRAFARTMARLHASTRPTLRRWNDIRQAAGLPHILARHEDIDLTTWEWDLRMFSAVGVEATAAAQRDFDTARSVLTEPGPFLAFSNGDPGANNFMFTSNGGRLIDFESAHFRHALLDAACLHVQHSVWMTIARPAGYGVVDVYRTGLAEAIPEAEDDALFGLAIAGASALRATERLRRFPKLDARPAGHESRRQMIATTETAGSAILEYGVLKDLAGWLTDVSLALRRRWPDADVSFQNQFTVR